MIVDSRRVKQQNEHTYTKGVVLYWMNRDMRLKDNWALLYAQQIAHEYNTELVICYNLDPQFLGGTLRQLSFKIQGLKELHADAEKHNIPFYTLIDSNIQCVLDFIKDKKVGALVTDFAPLRIQRKWLSDIVEKVDLPVFVVDAHNIVPVWEASDKKEFAAYTLRSKINKKLKDFLTDFPKIKTQSKRTVSFQEIDLDHVLKTTHTNREVKPVTWCKGGEKSAARMFKKFIEEGIEEYSTKRNDPVHDVQSNLSPYLHYGMISPQRVAYKVSKSKVPFFSKESFLEELIIRRELADNFCYFEPNYDNPKGFHQWFKDEHLKLAKEKREFLYTLEQFEKGETHDELWNACQLQMLKSGKMHGYLRMYWAKMIYAWSKDVKEAMKIAIYLNDTYELDGRDPNGYAGIAWCIGGVHDRPWFPSNPVFGKLRYMSRNGMKKKFDVKTYISKWLIDSLF